MQACPPTVGVRQPSLERTATFRFLVRRPSLYHSPQPKRHAECVPFETSACRLWFFLTNDAPATRPKTSSSDLWTRFLRPASLYQPSPTQLVPLESPASRLRLRLLFFLTSDAAIGPKNSSPPDESELSVDSNARTGAHAGAPAPSSSLCSMPSDAVGWTQCATHTLME